MRPGPVANLAVSDHSMWGKNEAAVNPAASVRFVRLTSGK